MAKITEITNQKRNKNRYNIFIDGEYAGALNIEEMAINQIKAGIDIDLDNFNEILIRDNEKYAFNLALKYISIKRRTVFETKKKLLSKDIDEKICVHAVNRVLEYGYLNDLEYAKDFVDYQINSKKFGKIIISYKLKTKGIDEQTIDKAMEALDEKIELSMCKYNFEKLINKYKSLEKRNQKQKIYRGLASKGFSYDIISQAMSNEDEE